MATAAPTGMNPAYLLDPSLYGDQQAVAQQQALAQALMSQGISPMPETQMAGNVALRNSPTQSIAKLVQILSGQNLQQQANMGNQALMQRQSAAMLPMFGMGQPQGPSSGEAAMGMGATQGSVGPTVANAQLQNSMAPQRPMQGPLSVNAAPPMTNLMDYATDPAAHMKAVMDQYAGTPEMKMAAAAYGVGTPGYMNALREQVQKAGYIAPAEARQGNLTLDRNNNPIAYNPAVEKGVVPTFKTENGFTSATGSSLLPGYANAAQTVAGAESAGKAGGKAPYEIVEGFDPKTNAPVKNYAGNMLTPPNAASGAAAQRNSVYTPDSVKIMENEAAQEKDPATQARLYAEANKVRQSLGMQAGPALGQDKSAKTVVERNQQVIADANVVPQDIENLTRMGQLASSSNFGPGASVTAKWTALASQVPGMGLIVNPSTLQQQQTNVTLMKKYMSDMAGRMSGASGTGTDARLQNAIDSLPNDAAPDAAIKQIVPLLVARRTARLDEGNIRQSLGDNTAAISKFETDWRTAYKPEAYEASIATRGMNAQQAAQWVRQHFTPAQARDVMQSRQSLTALGARFGE